MAAFSAYGDKTTRQERYGASSAFLYVCGVGDGRKRFCPLPRQPLRCAARFRFFGRQGRLDEATGAVFSRGEAVESRHEFRREFSKYGAQRGV